MNRKHLTSLALALALFSCANSFAQCSNCNNIGRYATASYYNACNGGLFARLFGRRCCSTSRYSYAYTAPQYAAPSCATGTCATGACVGGSCPIVDGVKKVAETALEIGYLAKVNAVRARYGLSRLALDANLDLQCASHCRNMATAGYIYHAPGCGYEIVASNSDEGVDNALVQWQQSPAHAAILLNPSFTRCGVQVCKDVYGRNYCAMRFR